MWPAPEGLPFSPRWSERVTRGRRERRSRQRLREEQRARRSAQQAELRRKRAEHRAQRRQAAEAAAAVAEQHAARARAAAARRAAGLLMALSGRMRHRARHTPGCAAHSWQVTSTNVTALLAEGRSEEVSRLKADIILMQEVKLTEAAQGSQA
eukprot:gene6453-7104_t